MEPVLRGNSRGRFWQLIFSFSDTRAPDGPRVWTQSHPEHVDCSKCDSIEERSGQLVVARGDPAKVLEPADGRLDPPALLVASAIVADRLLPIASAGDD